jgi:putative transcriptional regulator
MTRRDIFSELMEGFDALEEAREGKLTLRTSEVEFKPAPEMTAEDVRALRKKLHVSQPVFARRLRTEVRTIKNWEQGISKPNDQAAILLKLIERDPGILDQIAAL